MVLATKGGIVPPTPVRLQSPGAARRLRGVAAPPRRRRDRPLAGAPARPADPPGRRRRDARRAAGRGQDPRGRRLQPHPGPGRRPAGPPAVPARVTTSPSTRRCTSTRCATARSTPACATASVPLVWSPLAGGRLATGDGRAPGAARRARRLAAREGVDRATVGPCVRAGPPGRPVAIIGTQRPERIRSRSTRSRMHARASRRVRHHPGLGGTGPAVTCQVPVDPRRLRRSINFATTR